MLKTVSIAGIEEQGVPFKKESIALDELHKVQFLLEILRGLNVS